ncbi:MAG: sugar phosphate nucleotidyltransferase [Ignavibacteria bacterium]
MRLTAIILAAGQGKRMKNPLKSKVMYELLGKPLIYYVINQALAVGAEKIVIVVGHQKQQVINYVTEKFKNLVNKIIFFAHQDIQLGTGHAIAQTYNFFSEINVEVLILSGDVPLLKKTTLIKFISFHSTSQNCASLISAFLANPFGYGRIIRSTNGDFLDIREEKDASFEEKQIKEINSGIYLINSHLLFDALKKLDSNNAQKEYYLTDVFSIFKKNNLKIGALPIEDSNEIRGVNTIEQLIELETIFTQYE